ncbi:glycosyltransferase family 2 protein [Pisolithus sp. B1]|nr:glycosyltransferase family 2 protein [Pisolithus sp. B1]
MVESLRTRRCLVTGGYGFIGSHVAKALSERGHFVRIATDTPSSAFTENVGTEVLVGNVCDPAFCERAVRGIDTVLHFAANMGGMGVIHGENELTIYRDNLTMTHNMLSASRLAGVRVFFYASSACVYPVSLQGDSKVDVFLKESDAWRGGLPPNPQGLYGLEKLSSELLLLHGGGDMDIRIARFHNVFGPHGAWMDGREKVPAALIRKALAAAALQEVTPTLEIWGDGKQRRSFLYIDDCVDAVLLLLDSSCGEPVNIGSDRSVTIDYLAEVACSCAGLRMKDVSLNHVEASGLVGVSARNSDNTFIQRTLGWSPKVSLEEGIKRTAVWINDEMQKVVAGMTDGERVLALRNLQRSRVLDLSSGYITFAVLLPITSRGSEPPTRCLSALNTFANSLQNTTWRDTHQIVYLAIDEDDAFLRKCDNTGVNVAEAVLLSNNITDVVIEICNHPRGHVCAIWRQCAERAMKDKCDYFVLMGDDVVLEDEGWMRHVHAGFLGISERQHVPNGFGCVAFTDITFPGFPTFPIIHRTHMDIFSGRVIPDNFINQDGDPFLYHLYRRWNCSVMIPLRISNAVGGACPARYDKQHAEGWKFGPLDKATDAIKQWLLQHCPVAQRLLTIDVVIPSYRVHIPYLDRILNLQSSSTCVVMFIIIIDDPRSPSKCELEKKYGYRSDVCIRVNTENLGASASRNRGMKESTADWIVFLDDDVQSDPSLLQEAEKLIRKYPKAAGFVGCTRFPPAETIFETAVHLAGVTHFWDIAEKMAGESDMPWGVTANIIARRIEDGVEFEEQFPKTGGGEDIDFVRQKREYSIAHGGEGFRAAPSVLATHPWWNGGKRSYWRFYWWSKGDGQLIKLYPDLTYMDHAPNITMLLIFGIHLAAATFMGNIAHDMFRHLWRDSSRAAGLNSTLTGLRWALAVVESAIIRMMSEMGRQVGQLERKEFFPGRRFECVIVRSDFQLLATDTNLPAKR